MTAKTYRDSDSPYSAPGTWRAAVLRGWCQGSLLPLTTVAAVAWNEPSALSEIRVRWLPVLTDEESDAQNAWFRLIANADPTIDVRDFLVQHAENASLDVVEVAVPDGARTLGGVADLVLDDALAEPWFEQIAIAQMPSEPKIALVLDAPVAPHG